jgi:hypothetical protein
VKTLVALAVLALTVPVAAETPPTRSTSAKDQARADTALAGHYYLSGVMETGSELLLRPDGTFEWFLSYGALDQFASGHWASDGNVVTLKVDAAVPPPPPFTSLQLRIEGADLIPDSFGKGRYTRSP